MKRAVSAFFLVMTCYPACGAWTPPPTPDPQKILDEANADASAGRFSDALEKHIWFHQHSFPGFGGVRLSYALAAWVNLGKQYPPAITALEEIRNDDAKRITGGTGDWSTFRDVVAINNYLHEDAGTVALFIWVDGNNPSLAKRVYSVAQAPLAQAGNYQLCGKYIEARQVDQLLTKHRDLVCAFKRTSAEGEILKAHNDFLNESLQHDAEMLVALLVLNNRTAEADEAVAAVLKERDDAAMRAALETARKGIVPTPWPPA